MDDSRHVRSSSPPVATSSRIASTRCGNWRLRAIRSAVSTASRRSTSRRNRLASEAIADGFEELMWIDSDIAFEPQSVQRLRSHGLPIVCGLYPKKAEKEWSSQLLPGQKSITLGEGGGLIEILYAATGFLLVRRQVFLEVQRQQQLPTCFCEGRSTHDPVLPSDGDPFRRRPPLPRRGLRLLRTRLVVAGFGSSPTRRSVSSTSASTATVGKTSEADSLVILPTD